MRSHLGLFEFKLSEELLFSISAWVLEAIAPKFLLPLAITYLLNPYR
ncbi:hypothetical protein [Coleofasciculus sp. FACHB-1120]|nr:hypothetical protein [Coleofasciculus sp. FACHB-1120]